MAVGFRVGARLGFRVGARVVVGEGEVTAVGKGEGEGVGEERVAELEAVKERSESAARTTKDLVTVCQRPVRGSWVLTVMVCCPGSRS